MAKTHVDALVTVLGVDQKKCVIVDLDGTLWPGVLAETGAPFAFAGGQQSLSYVGLYFGLHEALLALKRRGVVLACVSKNDEATVRELWRYDDHYPRERLLTPDDFVTWRVNWDDKAANIASIADELGFTLESFVFIDDHPVERDRVRQRLPRGGGLGREPVRASRPPAGRSPPADPAPEPGGGGAHGPGQGPARAASISTSRPLRKPTISRP